jgi:hypothetical protein
MKNVMEKLAANDRTHAVSIAMKRGFLATIIPTYNTLLLEPSTRRLVAFDFCLTQKRRPNDKRNSDR